MSYNYILKSTVHLSLHNGQCIWFQMSPQWAEPCMQVEDSSQKHYISSKSIMKACRVEKEWGHLWYLTQSVCGILFLNWCQVETKSVIGLVHWIHLGEDTPICSKSFCCTFKKSFSVLRLAVLWQGPQLAVCNESNGGRKHSKESPSWDFHYAEKGRQS